MAMSSVFELGGAAVNKNTAMAMSGGTNFKPKIDPSAMVSDLPTFEIVKNPNFSKPEHDKTGMTFNRLLVLGLHNEPKRKKKARWVCKCNCGNYLVLRGERLRQDNIEYCMCAECFATKLLQVKAKNKYT